MLDVSLGSEIAKTGWPQATSHKIKEKKRIKRTEAPKDVKFVAPVILPEPVTSLPASCSLVFATGFVPLPRNAQKAAPEFCQSRRYQAARAKQISNYLPPRASPSTFHTTPIPRQACRRDLQVDHLPCGVLCAGVPYFKPLVAANFEK